jgi:hypothetical protein
MTSAKRLAPLFLAALALLLVDRAASAEDVIRFRNGRSLTGRILSETREAVVLELPGGGRVDVSRDLILEIIRDVRPEPEPGAPADSAAGAGVLRSEQFFLWSGEHRLGSRSLVVRTTDTGGLRLEEDVVFLDEEGEEDVRVHTLEVATRDLEPIEILYRESSDQGLRTLRAKIEEGRLLMTISLPGERREGSMQAPEGLCFPLSARERAIRMRERAGEKFEAPVFEPREENFFRYRIEAAGERRVDWDGKAVEATVLRRYRGERAVEEIWLDPAGRCLTEELNGPGLVAVLTSRERLSEFEAGSAVAASDEEERVRPLFVHPEAGFKVRKPTLSWSFEKQPRESTKVLSVSDLSTFAYFDVFILPETPEGGLLSSLAVDMERRFKSRSQSFEKLDEATIELGGEPAFRILASSMNKGEELLSLLVGSLHGGKTWLITMACPKQYFPKARPQFEAMLKSFEFID